MILNIEDINLEALERLAQRAFDTAGVDESAFIAFRYAASPLAVVTAMKAIRAAARERDALLVANRRLREKVKGVRIRHGVRISLAPDGYQILNELDAALAEPPTAPEQALTALLAAVERAKEQSAPFPNAPHCYVVDGAAFDALAEAAKAVQA